MIILPALMIRLDSFQIMLESPEKIKKIINLSIFFREIDIIEKNVVIWTPPVQISKSEICFYVVYFSIGFCCQHEQNLT